MSLQLLRKTNAEDIANILLLWRTTTISTNVFILPAYVPEKTFATFYLVRFVKMFATFYPVRFVIYLFS